MNRTPQLDRSVVLIVGAAMILAGAAGAQVATMSYGSSAVTFSPVIDNEGMVLTVSGGGHYFRKEFEAGEAPSFSIFDAEGGLLPDGFYNWELTPTPARSAIEGAANGPGKASANGDYQRDAYLVSAPSQSGTFEIANGSVVDPSLVEADAGPPAGLAGLGGGGGKGASASEGGPITNVVLTNADGVIRNSACIGFDCPNSPSFSDTTVLLVENNTRIKFDDTSTIGGFANNDWELEANSSLSGGGAHFAINDCGTSSGGGCADDPVFKVQAGAPANALFVSSAGRIGVRTGTPVLELHIKDGDTPSIRLEQDNSSGFTPQTWDIAGNETNFFIRDATNGSTLPLRIQPGASSNSLFISDADNVGIGTSTPAQPLHVRRTGGTAKILVEEASTSEANRQLLNLENNGNPIFRFTDDSGDGAEWDFRLISGAGNGCTVGGTCFLISKVGTGTQEVLVNGNGDMTISGTNYNTGSSREIKENFEPVDGVEILERLSKMPLTTWNAKGDPSQRHLGPIAEEWWSTFELGPGDKQVSLTDVGGVALAAIQGLDRLVGDLNREVEERDAVISELIDRLSVLEAEVDRLRQE